MYPRRQTVASYHSTSNTSSTMEDVAMRRRTPPAADVLRSYYEDTDFFLGPGWVLKVLCIMNEFLSSSLQRLRSWDDQQEKLEATLRTVRSATGEYELLLWLLLRSNKLQTAPESLKTVNHEIKTAPDWDMGMEPDLDPYMTPMSSRSSTNMEYTRS
ncbi:hypothetical protein ACJJTC_012957 [Scirpophaga incertulas]